MTDKLSISVSFDKEAFDAATAALDALAASADRAKSALDALFGEPTVMVDLADVRKDADEKVQKILDDISKGVRRTGHRFRL